MKNTKLTKILIMALSLVLLVGSVVAFAVSAADEDTFAIKSINISHEDSTKVLVAVDALGVDPATIEVKYTIGAGEEKTAKYYGLVDIYKDGNEYPVFYTEGIPAKDMGEDVTAEAHKAGTTPAAPEHKDISVATYLYTKLYKEGYAAQTTGEAAEKRALYESMLVYGANAQKVLWNNKHPGEERTLVTDYVAVYAAEGNINGKGSFVILKNAGNVEITYTGDAVFGGWNVSTYENGVATTEVKKDDTFALDKSAIVTVKVPEPTVAADFEGAYTEKEKTVTYNGQSWTATDLTFSAGYGVNYGGSANQHGATASVKTDEDGNKYLNISAPARVHDKDRSHSLTALTVEKLTKNANVTVLEWSQRANGTNSNFWQLQFSDSTTAEESHKQDGGYIYGGTYFYQDKNYIYFSDFGEWVDIRIEIYSDLNLIKIYANGVYQGYFDAWSANLNNVSKISDLKIDTIRFNSLSSSSGYITDIDIDNISFYQTYIPSPVKVETFDNELYSLTNNYTVTGCTDKDADGNPLHTTSTAINRYFGLASVEHSAKNLASSNSANIAGAFAEIRTDEATGNSYIYTEVPKRVCNRDRGYGIHTPVQVISKDHTLFVLEADINLVAGTTSNMNISVVGGGTAQFNANATSSFGGSAALPTKQWVSIRVVFSFDASNPNNNTATLYMKDADGNWVNLGVMNAAAGTEVYKVTTAPTSITINNGQNNILAVDNVCAYTAASID